MCRIPTKGTKFNGQAAMAVEIQIDISEDKQKRTIISIMIFSQKRVFVRIQHYCTALIFNNCCRCRMTII